MDDKTALKNFFKYNNIDKDKLTNPDDIANFDHNIDNMQKNTELWLETFDEEDRETFLMLLSNYTYLSYGAFIKRIKILTDQIINNYGIESSKILFVTVEGEDGTKCGGDDISSGICRVNQSINEGQIIRTVSKVDVDLITGAEAIVFMDDIVATGLTTYKCIKAFLKRFEEDVSPKTKLVLAPLVITSRGKRFINEKAKEDNLKIYIEDTEVLKSAFKGDYIFSGDEIKEREKIVEKYERMIDEYEKEEKSYYFGFQESKLLFSTYYDTANNTLCSFWKPTDTHHPLFKRSQKRRLSVNDMKNSKRSNAKNAYNNAKSIKAVKKHSE